MSDNWTFGQVRGYHVPIYHICVSFNYIWFSENMSDVKALEEDALSFAKLATDYDMKGQTELAIFYYTVSVQILLFAHLMTM